MAVDIFDTFNNKWGENFNVYLLLQGWACCLLHRLRKWGDGVESGEGLLPALIRGFNNGRTKGTP